MSQDNSARELTRSSGLEVLNRRREMLRLRRLGVEPRVFIPSVASKYGVKVDAVRRDWSKRTKWMTLYLRVEDVRSLAIELLLCYDMVYEEALLLVEEEKNPNVKAQRLYLLLKVLDRKMEIMRQLGVFEILRCDYESKAREQPSARAMVERNQLAQELGLVGRKPSGLESTNRKLTAINMWRPNNESEENIS